MDYNEDPDPPNREADEWRREADKLRKQLAELKAAVTKHDHEYSAMEEVVQLARKVRLSSPQMMRALDKLDRVRKEHGVGPEPLFCPSCGGMGRHDMGCGR